VKLTSNGALSADVLKRPRVLVAIAAAVVVLIAWYFAWWSPESGKLSSVRGQEAKAKLQTQQLNAKLLEILREDRFVAKYHNFLSFFSSQVPVQPEQGQLVYQLGRLQDRDHVDITTLSASATAAPVSGVSLSTIPVSLTVTGSHDNVIRFLNGLYSMSRLLTIQSIAPSATSAPSNTYNVLGHDGVPFSLAITGTAYFSGQVVTASSPQAASSGG
jgi:Tfp pilus assembly protein PilO